MKLCPPYLLSHNHTTVWRTIVSECRNSLLIGGFYIIGMRKVEIGTRLDTSKHGKLIIQRFHLVPAHMRNLRTMRNTPNSPTKQAETVDLPLIMMICQQLHT